MAKRNYTMKTTVEKDIAGDKNIRSISSLSDIEVSLTVDKYSVVIVHNAKEIFFRKEDFKMEEYTGASGVTYYSFTKIDKE